MILDLNAKRAERAKVRGEGIRMILGDQEFQLVDELPIEIGSLANENRIDEALRLMLADAAADWDRLLSCKPSFNDVLDIVAYYGTALGESLASTGSSTLTTPPSKPTSSATTTSSSGTSSLEFQGTA